MGTRSLTRVYDGKDCVVNMYRQYDGYPSGHGKELATFLNSKRITNGIANPSDGTANGMGCLAAQMICNFKTEVGGIYMMPTKSGYDAGQDYEYLVYENDVIVKSYGKRVFKGSWKDFAVWCENTEL